MKNIVIIGLALFAFSPGLRAQTGDTTVEKTYTFTPESEKQELIIEVKPGQEAFTYNLVGHIFSGSLKVDLYRPDDERAGGFELITKGKQKIKSGSKTKTKKSTTTEEKTGYVFTYTSVMSKNEEGAKGNMNELITHPEAGKWIIRIQPIKAMGTLEISINVD